MNNYELRRKIAELEGWSDIQLGNERSLPDDENLELRGIPPVGAGPRDIRIIHYKIPNWLTDANAAMELCTKIANDYQACNAVLIECACGGRPRWTALIAPRELSAKRIKSTGLTCCEAICRLYVAWRQEKEVKQ